MYMMCFLVLYYYYYLYLLLYYYYSSSPLLQFLPSLGSTTTDDNCIHYSTRLLTMETPYNTADNGTGNGYGFKQCT